jgi:pyruvate dehydrogenase E2 component (dihydrolipoamide acetyltransferase)
MASSARAGALLLRRWPALLSHAAPAGRLGVRGRRALASALLPDHKLLAMPKLSPTMEVGTIQEWVKAPGDAIEAGDVLAEIETDKATRSFEYNDEGFLARVFVEEGARDVRVGQALAIVVEEEADIAAFKDYVLPAEGVAPVKVAPPKPAAQALPQAKPAKTAKPTAPKATGARVMASPLARNQAAETGIVLSTLTGTGPNGLIVSADVAAAIAAGTGSAAVASVMPSIPTGTSAVAIPAFTDMDATKFQKVAAQRLTESKQTVPHYYVSTECTVDGMLALRAQLNAKLPEGAPRLSVNDFIVKSAAAALRRVPEVNAQWMGDKIRMFHSADISVAVQTPNGLITPIVKEADRKGIREISGEVKELAERARAGKLAPDEFMGGTFTISNLGMFGVNEFAAIVNPPQAAILAVGTSTQRLVPDATKEIGFSTRTVMTVTLSCDHRVIDGAVGALWLKAFKSCLEDPVEIIL